MTKVVNSKFFRTIVTIAAFVIAFFIASAIGATAADAATASSLNVIVNGQSVAFNDNTGRPVITNENRTLVPMRGVAEAYGAQVSWDPANYQAVVKYSGTTVKVPVGQNYLITKSGIKTMDTRARIIKDRTYLPVRAVMEELGTKVDFDGSSNTVLISSPSAGASSTHNGSVLQSTVNPFNTVKDFVIQNGTDKNGLDTYTIFKNNAGWYRIIYDGETDNLYLYLKNSDTDLFLTLNNKNVTLEAFSSIMTLNGGQDQMDGRLDKTAYGNAASFRLEAADVDPDGADGIQHRQFIQNTTAQMLTWFDQFASQNIGLTSADFGFVR